MPPPAIYSQMVCVSTTAGLALEVNSFYPTSAYDLRLEISVILSNYCIFIKEVKLARGPLQGAKRLRARPVATLQINQD